MGGLGVLGTNNIVMEVTKHLMGTRSRRHRHRNLWKGLSWFRLHASNEGHRSDPIQGADPHVAWLKNLSGDRVPLYTYSWAVHTNMVGISLWRERLLGGGRLMKETPQRGERTDSRLPSAHPELWDGERG